MSEANAQNSDTGSETERLPQDESDRQLINAILFAPLIGCILGAIIVIGIFAAGDPNSFFASFGGDTEAKIDLSFPSILFAYLMIVVSSLFLGLFIGIPLGLTLGWISMGVMGLPAHALLLRFNLRHWLAYVCAGVIVGIVAMRFFFASFLGENISGEPFIESLSGPIAGALSGGFFWLIRRPDRMQYE